MQVWVHTHPQHLAKVQSIFWCTAISGTKLDQFNTITLYFYTVEMSNPSGLFNGMDCSELPTKCLAQSGTGGSLLEVLQRKLMVESHSIW